MSILLLAISYTMYYNASGINILGNIIKNRTNLAMEVYCGVDAMESRQ